MENAPGAGDWLLVISQVLSVRNRSRRWAVPTSACCSPP